MANTEAVAGTLSESEHATQLRRAVIASTVGTTIEWYDFLLYGQVAVLVFGCAVVSMVATALLPHSAGRDLAEEHA